METETEAAASEAGSTLYGKVIGIVEHRVQLQAVTDALKTQGLLEIEVMAGPAGIQRLDTWRAAVSEYFFGDMEVEMVQRYLDAVQNGWLVFAAMVVPEEADQAGKAAKELGATDVVHFGNSVIRNY